MGTQTSTSITTGDGVRIAYRFDGEPGLPVLLLSNSIGTDLHMWDGQVPAFTEHFRLLRYDNLASAVRKILRGHRRAFDQGRSARDGRRPAQGTVERPHHLHVG